jgi:hypothetical protein
MEGMIREVMIKPLQSPLPGRERAKERIKLPGGLLRVTLLSGPLSRAGRGLG